jgi:hypothetical protein
MSLARLLRDQGRSSDAMALLQTVYDRFTEGFDTATESRKSASRRARGAGRLCQAGAQVSSRIVSIVPH